MFFGRGKNKIQNPYTIQDVYINYLSNCDNDLYKLKYNIYKNILCDYYKGMIDYLFETSLPYKLPYNLGEFQIIKKRTYASSQNGRFTSIDWSKTNKVGKTVYHLNDHSNGYKYLFTWNKRQCRSKAIRKYRFIPTRANKRKLAYYIKNKIKDYFEKKSI